MIDLHERMLPTSVGVEPVTSWSPVGRRIQLSHQGRLLLIYKSPRYFQLTLSQLPFRFRRKSSKPIFQDGHYSRNLGFPIATIWAIFDLQVTLMLPTKFQVSLHQKKGKIDFQDGHHLGFPIGTILAIFISTSHPDASYEFSNQLALWFRKISKKKKKRVSRWPPWWPSWISDPNNLSYYRSTSHLNASYQVSSQTAVQFRRRSK